jgi:hypothetical protein
MLRWFYVAMHLLMEAGAARRDVRIRFLKAQSEILRCKLGGNRALPSPDGRVFRLRPRGPNPLVARTQRADAPSGRTTGSGPDHRDPATKTGWHIW